MSCFIPVALNAQVSWEKVVSGVLDGDTLPGLYTGGFERSKPTFCDIDRDGDFDMFIGGWDGTVTSYENIGTPANPIFRFDSDNFSNINVWWGMKKGYSAPFFVDIDADGDLDLYCGDYVGKVHFYRSPGIGVTFIDTLPFPRYRHSCPTLCDIDADNDYDLFIGEAEHPGMLIFYENIGDSSSPVWSDTADTVIDDITLKYAQIDPVFCDIDGDNDFDLFVGEKSGNVLYWENEGDSSSPVWSATADTVANVFNRAGPSLADIDGDGDFDLFVGGKDGLMRFYRNTGNSDSAKFEFVTDQFNYLDFGYFSAPAFADIDDDGDMDMIVGTQDGKLRMCRNVGSAGSPKWSYEEREYIDTLVVEGNAAPTFVDIDDDGDEDLFIGNHDGKITYYRNDDTGWAFITNTYLIDLGLDPKPTFADIDGDGDYDLFIGEADGKVWHYKNDGNSGIALWTFRTESYAPDTVGGSAAPAFADVDLDGDLDMFIGVGYTSGILDSSCGGYIYFYRNDGDSITPIWTLVDTAYNGIDVGRYSTPVFTDIDGDGDYDLFVGEADGGINFWRNELIGVEENENAKCKMQNAKLEIYPNPFKEFTVISFQLSKLLTLNSQLLTLTIYDLTGRLVKTFFDSQLSTLNSQLSVVWDGTDNQGKRVNSGVYFCRFEKDGARIKSVPMKLIYIK